MRPNSFGKGSDYNNGNIDNRSEVKLLYPGLEDIVDKLIDANIPFDEEGNIDLTDEDGEVVASAEMLFRDKKIAINPLDDDSEAEFKKRGYRVLSSEDFDISMLTEQ